MKSRVLILIAAVVLGLAAAAFAGLYLARGRQQAATGDKTAEVLVAKEDMPKGTPAQDMVSGGKVEKRQIPQQFVASGALISLQPVESQVLAAPVTKGEQMTGASFQPSSESGLAFAVPKGMVAVSVQSDDVHGVAGLVKPGDNVVVVASLKADANNENTWVSKVLVPGARVLAAGSDTGSGPSKQDQSGGGAGGLSGGGGGSKSGGKTAASSVTVAVSASDMQKVILAQEVGQVWLALLPPGQQGSSETTGETRSGMSK